MNFKKAVLLGTMVAGISACGSDSDETSNVVGAPYSGLESSATLTEGNKNDFATAATESFLAQSQINLAMSSSSQIQSYVERIAEGIIYSEEQEPFSNTEAPLYNAKSLKPVTSEIRNALELQAELPTGIAVSEVLESECEGTATGSGDITENDEEPNYEYSASLTVDFDDYCIGRNGEFTYGVLKGQITFANEETSSLDSYSDEYKLTFNNLQLINKDLETDEILSSFTVSGSISLIENNEMYREVYSISVETSDGQSASVTYTDEETENSYLSSMAFVGSNGKSYQIAYNGDELLFEPSNGYVYLDSDVDPCYVSEISEEMPLAIDAAPIGPESSAELTGFFGEVILEDDSENVLVISYGSAEEESCSMEPTSIELNPQPEVILEAPQEV